MKITLEVDPEELAALISAVQERQIEAVLERKLQAIRDDLMKEADIALAL